MAASRGRHQFSSDEEEDLHEEMPNYMAGDYGVGEEHLGPLVNYIPGALLPSRYKTQQPGKGYDALVPKGRGALYLHDVKFPKTLIGPPGAEGKHAVATQGKEQQKGKKKHSTSAENVVIPASLVAILIDPKVPQSAKNALSKLLQTKQVGTGGGSKSAKKKRRQWKNAECDAWLPAQEGVKESQEEMKARRAKGQEIIKAAESDLEKANARYVQIHEEILPAARAQVQTYIEARDSYIAKQSPKTKTLLDLLKSDTIDPSAIRAELVTVRDNWNNAAFKGGPYTLTERLLSKVETENKVYRALAKRWLVKNVRKWFKANSVPGWEQYKELTKAIRKASKENQVRNLKRSADHWYSVLHPREKKAE
jgi:hypothetical protein